MKTKKTAFIASAVALASLSLSASAATVNLSGLQLAASSGVVYSDPGALPPDSDTATTTFVTASPDYVKLLSGDNIGGNGLNEFNDSAMFQVKNGFDGVLLGNLNYLLAQGAAGNVSFNLLSMTPGTNPNFYAYWTVLLTDPNNSANTILINAFSDQNTGANPFNKGLSVEASTSFATGGSLPGYGTLFSFGASWSTVAGLTDDGSLLGAWNVAEVGVGVGGWDSGVNEVGEISSLSLPDPVPDAASTLLLLGICFGALAVLPRRLRRA